MDETRRSWFVRPETTKLPLSDGQYLIVKTRLSAGEQRAVYARLYLQGADGELRVNPFQAGVAIVLAYLVDWSLCDDDGLAVPIRALAMDDLAAVLDRLEPARFGEVRDAIQAHADAQAVVRETQKKTTVSDGSGAVTSPLPSAAGGGSSGSVN